ncbi:sugar phosphate isomerase/epimerase [Candidatus Gracilibacteria bacterium]|nr:sugar phosphate isomerase/epimerase [Candidatus Gracilibacteria bacterium]MCF7818994.1 sugar phosphate isomerase/epimerase [Candidatus Gracilibacteria bacterium]
MLLLHSQSFPHYGLERFFEFARKAGFDGVEIGVNENFDTQNAAYLKKLEKRYEMPIKAFSLPHKQEEDLIEGFQEVVKEFPKVHLNLNSPQSFAFKYKRWMENIAPKLCKKYDLKLNRRNAPFQLMFGMIPQRTENSLFSLRQKGFVCLDLSALWASKEEIMRSINFLGDKMRFVYLSNVHRNTPYSTLSNGILPLESFLTKLAKNRYQGNFTLKLSSKALHEGEDEKVLETLIDSRKFFEEYFKNVKD